MEGEIWQPAIIFCHGLFRDRHELLERACALNQLGYPVLLFDFRNHGSSDRKFISLGFQEKSDVLSGYDFLKNRLDGKQTVLFGVSMGAVAAIHAAKSFGSDLKAIIADSPFLSLKETVTHHTTLFIPLPAFIFAKVFIWNFTRINEFNGYELNSGQAFQTMQPVPILLIYGQEDRRVPPSTARAIFRRIPHQKKDLFFIQHASHGSAFQSNTTRYLKVIREFLGKLEKVEE